MFLVRVVFVLAMSCVSAMAQSSGGFVPNQILPASQLNAAFSKKVDYPAFTTINGTTCTIGQSCTITAASSSIAVGSTAITGGTSGSVVFDNGGFIGEKPVSGTGSAVLTASPSISDLTVTSSLTATGLVTNADLANAATTVNGQTCTLGSTCSITAAATSMTVGTTTIASGTTGRVLYDNSGVLGELAVTGSGSVVLATSPSISGLTVTSSLTATGLVTLADIATQATNTVLVNATSGSASPSAQSVSGCSAAGDALIWTTNTGFGCNTSITAAAVPASGLTGSTLASGVTASSLTSVGTLAGLTVTTSFTATGLVTNGDLANASTTVNGQTCTLGSTCTVSSAATAITIGTTTIASGTSGYMLYQNGASPTGTVGEIALPLPVANGGTGAAISATQYGLPYFSSTTVMDSTAAGTSSGVLQGNASGAPTWVTTLSSTLQGNITAVGTVGTGVWQGTAVAGLYGGTGLTTAAVGDLIYASATTPTWSRLADVATGSILMSGGVTTAPTWTAKATASNIWGGTSNALIDAAGNQTALAVTALTVSTTTFTANLSLGLNFSVTLLTSSCSCTMASPTNVWAGASGFIEIIQPASGGPATITSWGSNWKFAGGTKPTLSTGANAKDVIPYFCDATNFCMVGAIQQAFQ